MSDKIRIIIQTSGGQINSIHSSDPNVSVEVLDHDEGDTGIAWGEKEYKEKKKRLEPEIQGMAIIY